MPEPELYVIYLGERGHKPDELILSQEFFGGRKTALELTAKILYDGRQGDIINQYVSFTKIYNEQVKLYGRTQRAVLETIKICKNKSFLKEYLETREREVVDIMMTVLSAERAIEARIMDAEAFGEARGEARGKASGKEEQARATAKVLNSMGMTVANITRAVGFDEVTVKEWLDSEKLQ